MKTVTRTFFVSTANKETKTHLPCGIRGNNPEEYYFAMLPKSEIKISNRQYHWGGGKSYTVEFPVELMGLFKQMRKPLIQVIREDKRGSKMLAKLEAAKPGSIEYSEALDDLKILFYGFDEEKFINYKNYLVVSE